MTFWNKTMVEARVVLRGIFQSTVWSRYAQASIPPRFSMIYTFVLPVIYFVLATYGFFSIGYPLSSIDSTFGVIYGDLWSFSLMITGIGSLVGIVFWHKTIWLEIMAMCGTVALMVWYILCLFLAALLGLESFRFLSLLLVIVTMPLPGWRILDIVRELRPPAHVD